MDDEPAWSALGDSGGTCLEAHVEFSRPQFVEGGRTSLLMRVCHGAASARLHWYPTSERQPLSFRGGVNMRVSPGRRHFHFLFNFLPPPVRRVSASLVRQPRIVAVACSTVVVSYAQT